MTEGSVIVKWEFWLDQDSASQDGPLSDQCIATSLYHAFIIGSRLKAKHGDNLRFVEVVTRIM